MRIRHYFTSPPAAGLGCELQEEEEEEGEKSASRGRQSRENRASQTSPKKPVRSLGRRPASQAGSEQVGRNLIISSALLNPETIEAKSNFRFIWVRLG